MGCGYNSLLIAIVNRKYSENSQTMPTVVIIKSNKDMKVTVEDILKIRPGKTKTFILGNPRECHSAVSLVCYVKKQGNLLIYLITRLPQTGSLIAFQ